MKTAIVTGASSGIGKAISHQLKNEGYDVLGLSRRGPEIFCDITDTKALEHHITKILKTHEIHLLVNCAGLGIFRPHEELSLQKIETLIDTNLKAPILLANLCLRSLKKTQGHIINVASIEATKHSKFSALYSATKAGLRSFSLCLFEELRNAKVRVTNINPDLTQTPFFDTLAFEPTKQKETVIDPDDLATQIVEIIHAPYVVTDITIQPQKFAIIKKPQPSKKHK
ncbi:SDR family NAD(P)-dependent oxidoreductase [Sulfurospirillum sp. 1612]|uniref:SDR family NAD(P)-dependent oxidoreductase n=1 Tax=Sulfurospirillum sp. 1612 TaxID=3094835 RepID=UPI002F9514F5